MVGETSQTISWLTNVFKNSDNLQKIGELETLIATKDKTIKELREAEVNLKLESQTNKEQAGNLKELQETCTKSYPN